VKKIGIYNPYLDTRGGGEKVTLAMAEVLAKHGHTVRLITHGPVDIKGLGDYMGVDLSRVDIDVVELSSIARFVHHLPLVPQGIKRLMADWTTFRTLRRKNYDVFINNCVDSRLPNPGRVGIYACMFPDKIGGAPANTPLKEMYRRFLRFLYRVLLRTGKKHAAFTYNLITANSRYTQAYIQDYWGVRSDIVYPMCDDMKSKKTIKKERIIVSVGRFFENSGNNNHKRHDFLVETFADLKDLQAEGWELHLIGSVAEDIGGLKYILHLLRIAQGAPIYFHFNAPRKEVQELYNRATIYWHATGYGSDPQKYPDKQEHFGITTVEAMSAGCVPIVIDSAGQRESVDKNINGFLWKQKGDLQLQTRKVARMSGPEIAALQKAARTKYVRFDRKNFEQSVMRTFDEVVS